MIIVLLTSVQQLFVRDTRIYWTQPHSFAKPFREVHGLGSFRISSAKQLSTEVIKKVLDIKSSRRPPLAHQVETCFLAQMQSLSHQCTIELSLKYSRQRSTRLNPFECRLNLQFDARSTWVHSCDSFCTCGTTLVHIPYPIPNPVIYVSYPLSPPRFHT